MVEDMNQVPKSRKKWIWGSIIVLIIFVDLIIFGPSLAEKKDSYVADLNGMIALHVPIYGETISKSIFSLRSTYFYEVKLVDGLKTNLHPRNIGKTKFLGFSVPEKTKLKVTVYAEDPGYKEGKFLQDVASFDLIPGLQTVTIKGEGDLSSHQLRIDLDIQESNLDIRVKEKGWLWDTYEAAEAYLVKLNVTKIRVIEVAEPA